MENNLTQPFSSPTANSYQATEQPASPKKNLLLIILGCLVVVAVGVGGGYYLGTQKNQVVVEPVSETSPEKTQAALISKLQREKLVKHEGTFFTVQYPSTWYTWMHGRGVSHEYFQINSVPLEASDLLASNYAYISFDVQELWYTEPDTLEELKTYLEENNRKYPDDFSTITDTILVDGVPALVYVKSRDMAPNSQSATYSKTVWLVKDEVKYIFTFTVMGKSDKLRDETKNIYLQDFDEMISGLKLHIPDTIKPIVPVRP